MSGKEGPFSYLLNYSKHYGKRKTKSVTKYHMILNTRKVILDISQTTTSQYVTEKISQINRTYMENIVIFLQIREMIS